ncbi:acyl-CoA dehydrogenase [Desulfosarcina ovata subsp. sediminis]|uniref:Acyl-CoA dehydrogenase n=1 Tax=Desulfosarcina ovata subsp. sediminis TaxID=885957 RepID=A0A5K7ZL35_9BACT|nr:acyl-CoA dehydrogenase [Desulfosarcina ovata]BBO80965.1 acyl-CoA dehydrogenase [Desulfosarcina ovata subsp. sediminis]
MAQTIADRRDIDFVLHEQLDVASLRQYPRFADFDRETVDLILDTASDLAVREILPTLKVGDTVGCRYENNVVVTPEAFKQAWRALRAGDWFAIDRPREAGGQGMPSSVAAAARSYLIGANMGMMFPVHLIHGPGMLIEMFGSDAQKAIYLEKLYAGTWGCSMMLTEPDSGSDLSNLKTTAVRNADGTFLITGNKIFTSFGEQDLTDNIIHLVLGRIQGAPRGARGISLFLVPKFHINGDGSLGPRNGIYCTGIENKMGHHGTPSCSMSLGANGDCSATLLGPENQGLAVMFHMMNKFRQIVGNQGMSISSVAYLHALEHARQRIQGVRPGDKKYQPVTIINHPDIRRMLMTMKVYIEGTRSMIYYIAHCEDKQAVAETEQEERTLGEIIDFLIPVAKAFITDRAVEICNMSMQIFGGYGYIKDYPVEQLVRDVKILTIYEGTNGVQAMDLAGRKLMMQNGRLPATMIVKMRKCVAQSRANTATRPLAEKIDTAIDQFEGIVAHLQSLGQGKGVSELYLYAYPFMEVVGDMTVAWMLLWRASVAAGKIAQTGDPVATDFYRGQLLSAEHFVRTMLPVTLARMQVIRATCTAATDIADGAFGGSY